MWIPDDLYRGHVQINLIESNFRKAKNSKFTTNINKKKGMTCNIYVLNVLKQKQKKKTKKHNNTNEDANTYWIEEAKNYTKLRA